MGTRKDFKKTKYTGIYVKEDSKTKIKTYLARAKVSGIEIEQIVGYSNDEFKTNPSLAFSRRVELINIHKAGKSTKKSDNPTLDKFFQEFQELRKNIISKNRHQSAYYFYDKYIPNSLRKKKLKDVTSDDLQKIINKMVAENKKASYVLTVKEIFSPLYKKAIESNVVDKNITLHLKIPKFDNTRYFSLPNEKAKALIDEIMNIADNKYRIMFMFLLRGRRSNEIRSLTWSDINFEDKIYTIQDYNNKTRSKQTYLLDNEIIEHLKLLPKDSGLIFKSNVTGEKLTAIPKRLWKRIKENANIDNMRIHDFRHLLGYTLVNNKVPLESIQRALGHKQITTTQKYSNQREQMAKDAVDTFLNIVGNYGK